MAESQGNAVPNFSSFDSIERRPGSHDRRNKLKLSSLPISSLALMNNTSSGYSDLMNFTALSREPPTTTQHHHHHHHHHHHTHHNNHHSQHNSHQGNHQSHHGNHQSQHHSGSNHQSHHGNHQSHQGNHHSHQGNHHSHQGNHHSHQGNNHNHQAASPQAGRRVDGAAGGGGELARRSLPKIKPFSQTDIVWEKSREKFKFCQSIQSTGTLQVSPNDCYDFTSDDMQDLGEIGRGAFGTVNKMVHRTSGTVMAVKRIRSTVDEKEQKQLLMDLEVVMKSNECPCIVQFYGALFKEGDCWICMELMDTSLDKFYKFIYEKLNQRIPETTLGKITVATVLALNYLKEKLKIIHRDVKPSNILLDRRGNIKLCDFGISGQLVDSIARTRDAGCRPYMAPERIDPDRLRPGYDVRSDVWSLGITLIEVATGRFPYPKWNSVFDQLSQVVKGDPPRLTTNQDPSGLSFSFDFVQFVNTCLIKDEQQRPKYNKLLEHAFIRRSEAAQVDVASYVSHTLDTMANHGQSIFTMNMQ